MSEQIKMINEYRYSGVVRLFPEYSDTGKWSEMSFDIIIKASSKDEADKKANGLARQKKIEMYFQNVLN